MISVEMCPFTVMYLQEAANAERTAQQNQTRSEVLKLEAEIKTLRAELTASRDRAASAEQEAYTLRKYKETHGDPEVLVGALKAMREKNVNIEKALSAETKLKMDLFSALGEARRELGIKQGESNRSNDNNFKWTQTLNDMLLLKQAYSTRRTERSAS